MTLTFILTYVVVNIMLLRNVFWINISPYLGELFGEHT